MTHEEIIMYLQSVLDWCVYSIEEEKALKEAIKIIKILDKIKSEVE